MRNMLCAFLFLAIFTPLTALGSEEGTSPDVQALQALVQEQDKKIEMLMTRIQALEEAQKQAVPGTAPVAAAAADTVPEWTRNINIKGDFRYRHEMIDQDGARNRNRQRIRLRLGLDGKVSDTTSIGVQIASGSSDPTSTNQTLDDGFSSKGLNLDMAYVNWKPDKTSPWSMTAGKMKNPYKTPGGTDLIWDSDVTPEGIAASYRNQHGRTTAYGTVAGLWVDERSGTSDAVLYGTQIGMEHQYSANTSLMLGMAFYDYAHARNKATFVDLNNSFGNTRNAAGNYANDFNELEVLAEYDFQAAGRPAAVFADYVTNTAAGSQDTGWLVGASIGKCKDPGSSQFGITYRRLEADAIIGAFTDADYIGGGTNGKGFKLTFDYQLDKKSKAGLNYFISDRGLSTKTGYNKLQADLAFKF